MTDKKKLPVEPSPPKCKKCGNIPLKCKFPDDCGLEDL